MESLNFTTGFTVDRTAKEVFDAVNNVRGWWSKEIEGNTDQLDEIWQYHYQDVHRCEMKITEFIPYKRVAWKVLNNHFSFTKNKEEWKGDVITFDISEIDNKTTLRFTQIGLVPANECYDICENAWKTYIQKSLYRLVTTGTGEPNDSETPQTENEKDLATPGFTTTFFVDKPADEVFAAINNVRGWWQGDIDGNTSELSEEFTYRMNEVHYSKQKIVELIPGNKIAWLVTDSRLNFTKDKSEWTGTKIVFNIAEINNKTQVRFTQHGLVPSFECYEGCSGAWEKLIGESLNSLITTGKGTKVFD